MTLLLTLLALLALTILWLLARAVGGSLLRWSGTSCCYSILAAAILYAGGYWLFHPKLSTLNAATPLCLQIVGSVRGADTTTLGISKGKHVWGVPGTGGCLPLEYRVKFIYPSAHTELFISNKSYLKTGDIGGANSGEFVLDSSLRTPDFLASLSYATRRLDTTATLFLRDFMAPSEEQRRYVVVPGQIFAIGSAVPDCKILLRVNDYARRAPNCWLHYRILLLLLTVSTLVGTLLAVRKNRGTAGPAVWHVTLGAFFLVTAHYVWLLCLVPPVGGTDGASLNIPVITDRYHYVFWAFLALPALTLARHVPAVERWSQAGRAVARVLFYNRWAAYSIPYAAMLSILIGAPHGHHRWAPQYLFFALVVPYMLWQFHRRLVTPGGTPWIYAGWVFPCLLGLALTHEVGLLFYYLTAILVATGMMLIRLAQKNRLLVPTLAVCAAAASALLVFTKPYLLTRCSGISRHIPGRLHARSEALRSAGDPAGLLLRAASEGDYEQGRRALFLHELLQFRSGGWYVDDTLHRDYAIPYYTVKQHSSVVRQAVNDEAGSIISGCHGLAVLPLLLGLLLLCGLAFHADDPHWWMKSFAALIWMFLSTYFLLTILSQWGLGFFSGVDVMTFSATSLTMRMAVLLLLALIAGPVSHRATQPTVLPANTPPSVRPPSWHLLDTAAAFVLACSVALGVAWKMFPTENPAGRTARHYAEVAEDIRTINEAYALRWNSQEAGDRSLPPLQVLLADTATTATLAVRRNFTPLTKVVLGWFRANKYQKTIRLVRTPDAPDAILFNARFDAYTFPTISAESKAVPIVSLNAFDPPQHYLFASSDTLQYRLPIPDLDRGRLQDTLMRVLPAVPDNLDVALIPANLQLAREPTLVVSLWKASSGGSGAARNQWRLNNEPVQGLVFTLNAGDELSAQLTTNKTFRIRPTDVNSYLKKPVWCNGEMDAAYTYQFCMPWLRGVGDYVNQLPGAPFSAFKPYPTSVNTELTEQIATILQKRNPALKQLSVTMVNSYAQVLVSAGIDRAIDSLQRVYPAREQQDSIMRNSPQKEEKMRRGESWMVAAEGRASIFKIILMGASVLGGLDPVLLKALTVQRMTCNPGADNLFGHAIMPCIFGEDAGNWSIAADLDVQEAFKQSKNAFFASLLALSLLDTGSFEDVKFGYNESFVQPALSGTPFSFTRLPGRRQDRNIRFVNERSFLAVGMSRLGIPIKPQTVNEGLRLVYGPYYPNTNKRFSYPATSSFYLENLAAKRVSGSQAYDVGAFLNTVAGGGAVAFTDLELCTQIAQIFSGQLNKRPTLHADPLTMERHFKTVENAQIRALQELLYRPLNEAWRASPGTSAYLRDEMKALPGIDSTLFVFIKTGTSVNLSGKHLAVVISDRPLHKCRPSEVCSSRSITILIRQRFNDGYRPTEVELKQVIVPAIQAVVNSRYAQSFFRKSDPQNILQ